MSEDDSSCRYCILVCTCCGEQQSHDGSCHACSAPVELVPVLTVRHIVETKEKVAMHSSIIPATIAEWFVDLLLQSKSSPE